MTVNPGVRKRLQSRHSGRKLDVVGEVGYVKRPRFPLQLAENLVDLGDETVMIFGLACLLC